MTVNHDLRSRKSAGVASIQTLCTGRNHRLIKISRKYTEHLYDTKTLHIV